MKSGNRVILCPIHRVKYPVGKRCPRCVDHHEARRLKAKKMKRYAPATRP